MLSNESIYDVEFFHNFYLNFLSETEIYFRNFALCFCVWLLGYLLGCCVVYRRSARRLPTRGHGSLRAKRVLIAAAHPDDECMFFGPTIFRLCEQGADVYLTCLSNGEILQIHIFQFLCLRNPVGLVKLILCCFFQVTLKAKVKHADKSYGMRAKTSVFQNKTCVLSQTPDSQTIQKPTGPFQWSPSCCSTSWKRWT